MRTHLGDETLRSRLVDKMVKERVLGGQYADGSQKDGFLKYEKNRPVGIYDIRKKEYFLMTEDWRKKIDMKIGPLPEGSAAWRALLMDGKKEEKLGAHFDKLKTMDTMGAKLAIAFLKKTKDIGQSLVDSGVANSVDDVNAVLMNGFFWLYGPINEYVLR
jgi:hypothetical protein